MNIKLMIAGAVGYVLGRTKKGKAAIRLALWTSGHNTNVKDLARSQAMKFLDSEDGRKLVAQLRGPVLAGGTKVALSAYERGIGKLTDDLSHRTSELRSSLDESPAPELAGKAGTLAGTLTEKLGRWGSPPAAKAEDEAPPAPKDQDQDRIGEGDGDRGRDQDRAKAADRRPPSRHMDFRPAADRRGAASNAGRERTGAGASGSR
ncbi:MULTISPECIES: hypothetical protein [Pseudofrankia]|uniref:hypothetical protein n=1 Tax=Pseudofrankia TaxID=2994363 RepID=UPI000234D2BF|nr:MULTISPECIES: hypothetical protein [Pseudofrankia]OHV34188.1 hypothetical protein BCD49_25000 [Pseudofrankia sp. EUN1h]